MSRIHDALSRTQPPKADDRAPENSQHQFLPAWTVNEPDSRSPATEDTAGSELPTHSGEHARDRVGLVGFSQRWRERLATGPDGDPTLIEQFRRLAATLHHAQLNNGLRSVMVTSALPGDGKTLTSVNLALVLAESYRYKVLLIDADLRRPSISSVVELGGGSGLSEALRAPNDQRLALVKITSRLTLLPAGQPIANSIEALTSPRMRRILKEADAQYDWVILDSPPVQAVTDAVVLSKLVDGVILIVRADKTLREDVKRSVKSIQDVGGWIFGVIVNEVNASDRSYYSYGYGYGYDANDPRAADAAPEI